jgi:DNA/RNA endonuclease G (NUC1)
MKGHGDETEGQLSQTESFSFANVAPQMQAFNAPFWLAIEEDCLRLAETVGTVAVISGPVFKPEKGEPLLQTGSGTKVRIPIPTHFFKVIIARVDGRTTAIAFLVPHRADLKAEARSNYLVPVRAVEDVTGINFMPELGSNDALEKVPQQELVELLHDD